MNQPVSEQQLRDWLDGRLSPSEQLELEKLIEASPELGKRLEQVVGAKELEIAGQVLRSSAPPASVSLHDVMEQLRSEFGPRTPLSPVESGPTLADTGDPIPGISIGDQLGKLEIRREIGRGGMGIVYEGLDPRLGRQVAVKVLPPHLASNADAWQRFLTEARTTAQLTHPNIVAIHSIEQIDGTPVMVQQFVPGHSLQKRIQDGIPMDASELIQLATQLATGLATAHKRGVIHRDLKPDNILLDTEANIARIADFGLAKQIGSDSFTRVGTVVGTPAFMSPEQTRGETLDVRSDLFSLGAVLFTAASGRLPFPGDDPFVVMDRIRSQAEPQLSSLRKDLPEWFCALVHRLLAKRPADRVSTASEVIELLEQKNEHAPRPQVGRIRLAWIAGGVSAALAIVLFGIIVFFGIEAWRAQIPSGSTMVPLETPSQAPDLLVSPRVSGEFRIAARNLAFETLAEAISAAEDNETVTIHGNGPFEVDKQVIDGKGLRIYAAPGYAPVFRPSENAIEKRVSFLESNQDTHIRGLIVEWPIRANWFAGTTTGIGAIMNFGGKFHIEHCRVTCGTGSTCVGSFGGHLVISRCLLAASQGCCVGWRLSNSVLELENSLLTGSNAFLFGSQQANTETSLTPSIKIDRVSFAVETIVQFVMFRPNKQTVRVNLKNSVLDAKNAVRFGVAPQTLNPETLGSQELIALLRDSFDVQEHGCVHREGIQYISSYRIRQPARIFQGPINTLQDWLSTWNLEPNVSVAGTILTRNPDQLPLAELHEIRSDSPIPSPSGVNARDLIWP